jgi:hypothetical protein
MGDQGGALVKLYGDTADLPPWQVQPGVRRASCQRREGTSYL